MIACTAIAAALAAAQPGATVATGHVTCPERITLARRDYRGVTLDAKGATFTEGAALASVAGLTIRGGTWGTAARDTAARYVIDISASTDVAVTDAVILGGPIILNDAGAFIGGDRGGVQVRGGSRVTVSHSRFSGFRTGLKALSVTDFLIAGNSFTKSGSDGINAVDSHNGVVRENSCFWLERYGTSHTDCIQLWSLKDKPLQSDLWLVNNSAIGRMQGILSSDPKTGSGTRLRFHGNYIAIMQSHTITCGACTNSVATDNVLSSYPGAFYGVLGGKLKGFDPALGNVAERNVVANGTVTLPPRIWWQGAVPVTGSRFDRAVIGGVP